MNLNLMFEIQSKLVPEAIDLLMKRYEILKSISINQPIGRRALSSKLGLTERIIRTEIEKLNELKLVEINASGVQLTKSGENTLLQVQDTFYYIKNISELELKLKEKLQLKKVAVVPGDVDHDSFAFSSLGKKAAEIILDLIKSDTVIGITGGTTMACVVNQMKVKKGIKNLLVLPARGALNEELKIQANTIAAKLAEKLDAEYKLLYIPDNLDCNELNALKNNNIINSVLNDMKRINLLIFGLGNAKEMARRRNANISVINKIIEEKLVAETFGYYFNHDGKMRMQTNSVGITIEDFNEIKNKVGVAAGSSKAEAIYAISKFNNNFVLVTDEGAARKILDL